jgi:hypothetical protein
VQNTTARAAPRLTSLKRNERGDDRRGSNPHSSLVGFFNRPGSPGGRNQSMGTRSSLDFESSIGGPPSYLPEPPPSQYR